MSSLKESTIGDIEVAHVEAEDTTFNYQPGQVEFNHRLLGRTGPLMRVGGYGVEYISASLGQGAIWTIPEGIGYLHIGSIGGGSGWIYLQYDGADWGKVATNHPVLVVSAGDGALKLRNPTSDTVIAYFNRFFA